MTRFSRLLIPFVVLAALLMAGCDSLLDSGSPTEPSAVTITLSGTCRVSLTNSDQIICEDRTRTEPVDRIDAISFTLLDRNGLVVELRTVDPKPTPPRQVVFAGLATGLYSVEHVVRATDKRESRLIYRDLFVN